LLLTVTLLGFSDQVEPVSLKRSGLGFAPRLLLSLLLA
jgi:hypothetical protein